MPPKTDIRQVDIRRYRWEAHEKHSIFQQLLSDPAILPQDPEPIGLVSLPETIDEAKRRLELKAKNGGLLGLSTGYAGLDKITQGLGPGEVTVIFGDTAHGKSQLVQNITYNIAAANHPVLFIGLEMDNAENTNRFLDIASSEDRALMLPIIYPAKNDITVENIGPLVEAAKMEGCKLVVIDHLHWLSRSVQNQVNELSQITHTIKRVAVANQMSVLLVSHINRQGSALDYPPSLNHLKGSGSIEQDADKCIAVWRDIKNGSKELEIVGHKNRRGPLDRTTLTVGSNGVKLFEPTLFLDGLTHSQLV